MSEVPLYYDNFRTDDIGFSLRRVPDLDHRSKGSGGRTPKVDAATYPISSVRKL